VKNVTDSTTIPNKIKYIINSNKKSITNKVTKATLPPCTVRSIVFARWRQGKPHLIHASLGPHKSAPQMVSRSVQPITRVTADPNTSKSYASQCLSMGQTSFKNSPSHVGSEPSSHTWFLGQPKSTPQATAQSVHQFLQGAQS